MSDQQPQPTSGEAGTPAAAGPTTPDVPAPGEPVTAAAEAEVPKLAPDQEAASPKPDAPKDAPKVDAVRMEVPKVEASKAESPRIDAVKPEAPRFPGNVTIMSPGDRVGADAKSASAEGSSGKRRIGAMAAVVALATIAGALGGALATAGIGKLVAGEPVQESARAPAKDNALEAAVARIDTEIAALKAGLEHNSRTTTGQFNKANDRLDKVEKAQAEPAAKLARLSEAVDKLRAAQATVTTAAATPASSKDITGSIPQQAAAAPAPKPEVARLPTVEGWVLRDVANGGALIESRRGMYEVYAGDPVPGVGRVDAIRKQDGRWVVVTSKGLIVAR